MNRREFGKVLSVGVLGAAAARGETLESKQQKNLLKPQKNQMMHVSNESRFDINEKNLTFLERMGVKHKVYTPKKVPGKPWDLDEILRVKEQCAKHNIAIEILKLSTQKINVDGGKIPNYMLGNFPKGDREIDVFFEMIKTTAQAGCRCIIINLNEVPNLRLKNKVGRGGNRYMAWDLKTALAENPPNFYDKVLTAEENWERITHFLERVIPVATEYKIQMANHLSDPWLPPGFRGIHRVLHDFEGFKRYLEICPSPYHGLNFCVGCMAESLDDPGKDVYEIVQYFAERKKIFHFHYRNIIGGRNSFIEVYPDEGVINMHRVMQILRDTQYPYSIDPDHYPVHHDDSDRYQAAAFQFGYIKAMIQAVNNEVYG